MPSLTWRKQGLRFECTGCGDCCKREGILRVSVADCRRMAKHMEIALEEFQSIFTIVDPDYGLLLINGRDGCVMLRKDNKCAVHDAKPLQCSTYPFWSELLESKEAWDAEGKDECEGINRGPLISPEEITHRLRQRNHMPRL